MLFLLPLSSFSRTSKGLAHDANAAEHSSDRPGFVKHRRWNHVGRKGFAAASIVFLHRCSLDTTGRASNSGQPCVLLRHTFWMALSARQQQCEQLPGADASMQVAHGVSHSYPACPKCGVIWPPDKPLPTTECPDCGVVFVKFHAAERERKRLAAEKAEKDAQAAKVEAERAAKAAQKAAAAASKHRAPALPADSRLAACSACGGKVAYGAKTCPHCGAPGPAKKTSKVTLAVVGIGTLIFIGAIVQGGKSALPSAPASAPPRGSATEDQRAVAQQVIKLAGYRCDDVEYMGPLLTKTGFRVTCNASRYAYALVDEGGRWVVRLD
jgi:hypothetical protein